jgi:hypothetical protein
LGWTEKTYRLMAFSPWSGQHHRRRSDEHCVHGSRRRRRRKLHYCGTPWPAECEVEKNAVYVADVETMDAVNAPDIDLDPDMAAAWAAAQVLHKHGIDGAAYERLLALMQTNPPR